MKKNKQIEVNFDGLVGPTHNYSGLAYGNIASLTHKHLASNPKAAALQGLEKMHTLAKRGVKQALLPPHERPYLPLIHALGYKNLGQAPEHIVEAACSASSMWTANSATVTSSPDGYVHFTPANLCTFLHRAIETPTTTRLLETIFSDPKQFIHHKPLISSATLSDEGAANHTQFSNHIHLFVYGKPTQKFPARQTLEASQAIAHQHQIPDPLLAEQSPEAINAGVFHNDVISVGFENLFLYHEKAFTTDIIPELKMRIPNFQPLNVNHISLEQAVKTYLFNSQIVRTDDDKLLFIAPIECQEDSSISQFLTAAPFDEIIYVNLLQSMQNGGGPACLRLRVPLTNEQIKATKSSLFLTDSLYQKLQIWINKHYRDKLTPKDLRDPTLLNECYAALDELTQILDLGSFYEFQH